MKRISLLLELLASLAVAAPALLSTGCAAKLEDSGATLSTPAAVCAPMDVIYTGSHKTASDRAPFENLMSIGDTIYYEAFDGTDFELESLVEGGVPAPVFSGIKESYTRMWTDGTSFLWVSPDGLVRVPVAGGPQVIAAPSPLMGSAGSVVHDATDLYAFVASPPSLITQPLTATSASQIITLATLPAWSSGVTVYDAGDQIIVLHAGTAPDGSLGSYDIVAVSKTDGTVTPVSQPADSYTLIDVDGNGAFLGNTRTYALSSFTFDGLETVLLPSTDLQSFAATRTAHGADGTIYVSGQLLQPYGWRQPAFATVRPNGEASLVQCGSQVLQTHVTLAPQPDAMTVGTAAVYGALFGDGIFQIVKLPK